MEKRILFSITIILITVSMSNIANAVGGGGAVPITTIELTEEGNTYDITPTRLKFEFDGKLYAIQVRRIKEDHVWFLVMTLDMNNLEDITAYEVDDSFNLSISKTKEIDIDKDGIKDIFLELNNIVSKEREGKGTHRFADFSIKKINVKRLETADENVRIDIEGINSNEISEGEIQESILEPVIVLDQEIQAQPTFLDKIINFINKLFK